MTSIIRPGAGILYMKVGKHAQESLADIIKRKSDEIRKAGYTMWGYGGNTCHPTTMVQPFAEDANKTGSPIYLCMQAMRDSKHDAESLLRAHEYSVDGLNWKEIPESINVLGSRYALMIKNLREEDHVLKLHETRVALGANAGRVGSRYIRGRVDKACLFVDEKPELVNETETAKSRHQPGRGTGRALFGLPAGSALGGKGGAEQMATARPQIIRVAEQPSPHVVFVECRRTTEANGHRLIDRCLGAHRSCDHRCALLGADVEHDLLEACRKRPVSEGTSSRSSANCHAATTARLSPVTRAFAVRLTSTATSWLSPASNA